VLVKLENGIVEATQAEQINDGVEAVAGWSSTGNH